MDAVARPMLSSAEMMLWSAAAGAIGLVVLLALADTLYSRTRAASQTLAYLALCWGVVMLLSGLPAAIWPSLKGPLGVAQILSGPMCAAMGSFGASEWLSAHQRDRLMKVSLLTITLLCLAGGPLCLLLAPAWRLPASGALAIANLSVVLWLSVRATQLGDKLAWGLAAGCLFTLPAQIGLYSLALNTTRPSVALQAAVVMAALFSLVITAAMLWLRNRQTRELAQGDVSRRDPITQLYNGVVMVQKIIWAQRRRQRTRRDGALMAVMVFEPERLLPQIGQAGLNDLYIQLSRRMQRHTGAVNPAGRYYDRCFVVLLETMHSPRWIRTLGLRVASSLRRPMEVLSISGVRIRVTPDIAVGIVHLSAADKDVDQLLHEAQSVAEAARGMRSRAALLDPETHAAVPVEHAELGSSWRALRNAAKAAKPGSSSGSSRGKAGAKLPRAGRHRHKPA
jgi:GGDEF domain-containing protein